MIRVALDAAGGDHGLGPNVAGAAQALARWSDLYILLTGPKAEIERKASEEHLDHNRVEIVDAPEVVTMEDPATAPLRQKRNSSIRVSANLVREGRADALVSAGNTGAVMAAAKVVIGALEGVDRPALAVALPTRGGGVSVLVDVGANVDCKAHHLRQFAVMGSLYAQILGVENPRVGLLSIGEEDLKGNELTREVHEVLKKTPLQFIGNVDGKDVYSGTADVIVCDGFIGNVVLKVSEGLAETVSRIFRVEFAKNRLAQLGYLLSRGVYASVRRRLDYAEYGGAPLLGVRQTTIICHGRSTARAITNALGVAMECERRQVNRRIQSEIERLTEMERVFGAEALSAPPSVSAHLS